MTDLFNTGVRPIVDNYLLEESKKVRDYGNYWSASSAGYCYRKLIFERLKVPYVTEDARKQRVFSSGHIFHEWIQGLTKAAGVSIAQEVELIDDDLMVKGHIDDLVLVGEPASDPPENAPPQQLPYEGTQHLILYDYKTRNSRSFNFAKEPMHTHKMQLGTYLYILNKATAVSGWNGNLDEERGGLFLDFVKSAQKIEEARTLNIEKDTLRMAEVQYMWSDELEKEVVDYWTELNKYWAEKKLPPCSCETFMKTMRYNPYWYQDEPCSIAWYEKWKKDNAQKS